MVQNIALNDWCISLLIPILVQNIAPNLLVYKSYIPKDGPKHCP